MQPTQATTWITEARFAPYLEEADGEPEKALALYIWNARISAAAFETLHHVEVILRNAVDAQFAPLEGSAAPRDTWLENPAVLNDASRQRVNETIVRRPISTHYEEMLILAGLIDPEARAWVDEISRVSEVLGARP